METEKGEKTGLLVLVWMWKNIPHMLQWSERDRKSEKGGGRALRQRGLKSSLEGCYVKQLRSPHSNRQMNEDAYQSDRGATATQDIKKMLYKKREWKKESRKRADLQNWKRKSERSIKKYKGQEYGGMSVMFPLLVQIFSACDSEVCLRVYVYHIT